MGLFTLVCTVIGIFLVGLVALATLVAGWELLRQREVLDMMRRDSAAFAATSPLPLAAGAPAAGAAFARLGPNPASVAHGAAPNAPNWIETRPMILSQVPAFDDETVVRARPRELDLALD